MTHIQIFSEINQRIIIGDKIHANIILTEYLGCVVVQ